jgi:hyperosmotically inducible periplasmic protein
MKQKFKAIVPAMIIGMAFTVPAWAQNSVPASESMHHAGEKIEQAGSNTAAAAKDAYHGAKRAVKDTAITAKVKEALHDDKSMAKVDIDVDTTAGVVTLVGKVSSRSTAIRAEEIAMQTEGVKQVNNELTVVPMIRTN